VKLFKKILLAVSIGFNVFFVWAVIRIHNNKVKSEEFGGVINHTTWTRGLESFVTKLKEKDESLANKKYYFINVWVTWCIPCVIEIPRLDSLAGTLNKDVAYVFVSDQTDKIISDCIKRKKYNINNFVFINDMNDFVSGICNERTVTEKSYPINLIADNKGNIYFFSIGTFETVQEVKGLASIINRLP
jgi:thiol-disulfide isomerase/thioredoxin